MYKEQNWKNTVSHSSRNGPNVNNYTTKEESGNKKQFVRFTYLELTPTQILFVLI